MISDHYVSDIVERLSPANRAEGFPALLVVLLRALGKGRAVEKEVLGKYHGWRAERAAVLDQAPCTEYDEHERIVGYCVTLRETGHAFEVDGEHLYTWCALDALMFPAVTGKPPM